ncbi:hypothetical protein [Roseimicrobium sp. ORNL1]|uniref:hypothetical protein n=1 Tax=Roseimicrobium sp. ORNL1 TaxID=2711231 RepID=UPI0013E1740F|nr:hypothetical protein [Roseimicrobium sp. ORNL1]QIF02077.1 hypothetical protein G5S37_11215 [Roseimicrobium sp. ORNL1]
MKLHLLILAWSLTATLAAQAETFDSLLTKPVGGVTNDTPSLESAFPNEIYIRRTLDSSRGLVDYNVRVYAPELVDTKFPSGFRDITLVIYDEKGTQLVSTRIEISGIGHIPPSTEMFRSFDFSIHESLERTTAVYIGDDSARRIHYTRYRLPLKSIDHPKAHR